MGGFYTDAEQIKLRLLLLLWMIRLRAWHRRDNNDGLFGVEWKSLAPRST